MPTTTILAALSIFASALAAAIPEQHQVRPTASQVIRRATSTSTALITATAAHGSYVAPVTVNGVVYTSVLFDTGSNGLWVKSNEPSTGSSFTINYGSGPVSGTLSTGTVVVGGITVTNQVYGHATSWASYYNSFDGIIGLGPLSTYYSAQNSTWLNNVTPQLKAPYVGVNINDANWYPSTPNTFSFGYDESSHEQNPLVWTNADLTRNGWFIPVSSFGVPSGDSTGSCLVDTGGTNIFMSSSVTAGYWSQVPNASINSKTGQYSFPCSGAAPTNLPDFKPVIGGVQYLVPGRSVYYYGGDGTCYARIQSTNSYCILGQPFFYGTYVVIDNVKKALGLSIHVR